MSFFSFVFFPWENFRFFSHAQTVCHDGPGGRTVPSEKYPVFRKCLVLFPVIAVSCRFFHSETVFPVESVLFAEHFLSFIVLPAGNGYVRSQNGSPPILPTGTGNCQLYKYFLFHGTFRILACMHLNFGKHFPVMTVRLLRGMGYLR